MLPGMHPVFFSLSPFIPIYFIIKLQMRWAAISDRSLDLLTVPDRQDEE